MRIPSEDEIAHELCISTLEYQQLLGELHGLQLGTLHRQNDDDAGDEELVHVAERQEDDPFFRCLRGEISSRLAKAIEDLPERERLVIELYYQEELTRREVSLVLKTSESRVQQIRTSGVLRLRASLSDLFTEGVFSPRARSHPRAEKLSSGTKGPGADGRLPRRASLTETRYIPGPVPAPRVSPVQAARALAALRTAATPPAQ